MKVLEENVLKEICCYEEKVKDVIWKQMHKLKRNECLVTMVYFKSREQADTQHRKGRLSHPSSNLFQTQSP